MRSGLWVLMLLGCLGCRTESPPSEDVGAPPATTAIDLPELGIRLELPPSWTLREVSAPTGPTARPRGQKAPTSVRTWAEARRREGNGGAFLVPARIVVTSEAAGDGAPEEVFSRVLSDLKTIGDRPGVKLERSGFASRQLSGFETARLRVRYRVGEAPGTRVRHQSLVILQPATVRRGRELRTITATFADRDAPAVSAEIERALDRIELTPAPAQPSPKTGETP
ncbi:MAG: hypothetical protein AAFU79_31785 [Myxococcota bacterium]